MEIGTVEEDMQQNRNEGSHRQEAFFSTRELCREWAALYEEARRIEADSSMLTVAWKVSKFLFNEGNPVGLLLMLFYFNANETGLQAYINLIINIFWSFAIAYYLCSEKREICLERQGGRYIKFFRDVLYKTFSLLIDWIHEWKRGEKRRKKIRAIEDNIYRTQEGVWSLKKNGCIEMTKLFSSQLRYLREDILTASVRSFSLVMYFTWRMTNYDRNTLTICHVSDVFKLMFTGWTLIKITTNVKSFHDARRMYYAIQLLWGKTWKVSADDSSINIPDGQYSSLQAFERDFIFPKAIYTLDFFITFTIIASRFLQALIIIVAFNFSSGLLWCCLLVLLNIFILDFCVWLGQNGLNGLLRSRANFDNPPTGYVRNKGVYWIDRCMAVLFFDYGYASIHGTRAVRFIFVVPSTVIFISLCLAGYVYQESSNKPTTFRNMSNLDYEKGSTVSNISYSYFSFAERCSGNYFDNSSFTSSLSIKQTLNHKFNSEPIDVLSYIGGVTGLGCLTVVVPLLGYVLDLLYHYLLKREQIDLQIFDGFPFFDAADLYRTLLINTVGLNADNNHDDPPDPSNHGQNIANEYLPLNDPTRINRVIEKHLRVLMSLTIIETEDFYEAWRMFPEYSTGSDLWVDIIVHLALAEEKWSDILQETERRHGIQINDILSSITLSNGNNVDSTPGSDLNPSLAALETLVTRIIDKFQDNDHPLQPFANEMERKGLIRGIHEKIQNVSSDQNLNPKLFIKFCNVLNERLGGMTSSRIERTFDMLQQVVKKTYE